MGEKSRLKKNQPQLTLKFVYEIKSKATLLVETLPDYIKFSSNGSKI